MACTTTKQIKKPESTRRYYFVAASHGDGACMHARHVIGGSTGGLYIIDGIHGMHHVDVGAKCQVPIRHQIQSVGSPS
jgi:hypothetical protein